VSEHAPVSPCNGVCTLDPVSHFCRGCWRTIEEIAQWPRLSTHEKRRVLVRAREREAQPQSRHAAGELDPG
jgi:uncharacterized protein